MTTMVFFATLIASCVLLRHGLPFPPVPVVREKIEQLARCGDDYDVLFLGSSRVYFQHMQAAAKSLKVEVQPFEVLAPKEFEIRAPRARLNQFILFIRFP